MRNRRTKFQSLETTAANVFQRLEKVRPNSSSLWNRRSLAAGFILSVSAAIALAANAPVPQSLDPATIRNTRHNLSVSGPGTMKSSAEQEVCIFCHTTHSAAKDAPLWNRFQSASAYTPYSSTTMKARPGQPTGSSKLCLSCHDGTVAMGMVVSRKAPIRMAKSEVLSRGATSNIGTDLSDDHPISFVYDSALTRQNGELRDPATLGSAVRLDKDGQLQCTSCHDAHNNRYGKFLVKDNTASALCVTCHEPRYWQTSSHRTSAATWNGSQPDPWPHTEQSTVAANACENCHKPHTAGTREQLLNFAGEEQNCYSCHNGNVAAKNIEAEFRKFSIHPVATTTGVHTPVEDAVNAPRHVECADCHNPHASQHAPASAPAASGALAGVRGVGAGGSAMAAIQNEYELCFRCHGDGANKGPASVNRVTVQTNTRLEFSPSNGSFHPVEAAGRSQNVPSLRSPYTVASRIYCTDCHNSDKSPAAGGSGPNGPHGSAFAPLLERQLVMTDFSAESAEAYALCYKCHDRDSILGNASFKFHREHVVDQQTSCTTCHDSHGAGGTGLINFNPDFVKPFNGQISWNSQGSFGGTCTMTCHGTQHDQTSTQQGNNHAKILLQKNGGARAAPRR